MNRPLFDVLQFHPDPTPRRRRRSKAAAAVAKRAMAVLAFSRPADPRDCAKFNRAWDYFERIVREREKKP